MFCLLVTIMFSIWQQSESVAAPKISTWAANDPDWNRRLGVSEMRTGCSSTPSRCLQNVKTASQTQQVSRWVISVKQDAEQWPPTAREYSRLSATEPSVYGIDVDDFVSTLKDWNADSGGNGNRVLGRIIRNLKQFNGRLRFGITLYEDELTSPLVVRMAPEVRNGVGRVTLYLHYRANAAQYGRYVLEAKKLFPGAEIWAGSYAYDRMDYLPCAQGGTVHCSRDEEFRLYRTSLQTQLNLLDAGAVAGLEFYPGFFGREADWHGWANPRICRPQRRSECIALTREMRALVVEEFAKRYAAPPMSGPGQ